MTTQNNSEKLDELVFESRNKEYGAYAIRRSYGNTMARSMTITLSSIGLLVLAAVLMSNKLPSKAPGLDVINPWDTTTIVLKPAEPLLPPPVKDPVVPPTHTPPPSNNLNFNVTDSVVQNDNKPIIDPSLLPGDGDTKGKADSSQYTHTEPNPPAEPVHKDPPPAVQFVDVMPSYPNMNKFIPDNLVYPPVAKESNTTGTVVISFIVEMDGSISDVKIARDIGDGCGQEAMRVVKLMKTWTPGKLKGVTQRTYVNLPIKFSLK